MKSHLDEEHVIKRSLSIEQWHQLGLRGDRIPVTITLAGDSMRPLIRRGRDRVTILPVSHKLRIGDIVLFRRDREMYVVHRIWKIRDGMVQTLGDNCMTPDSWMPLESVWGQIVRLERFGRSWRMDTCLARAWGNVWMALFPLRVLYKKCRRAAGRCFRSVFPKKE